LKKTVIGFSSTATITGPVHVHVRYGKGEAVFNVEDEIALRESQGLKIRELSKAQQLAEENKQLIIQKWHEHLE
jgi:Domain of unknown function (DUF4160)